METLESILSAIVIASVVYFIYKTARKFFKPGCDHRFDMETIRDFNFEPKCKKCGKYVSAIVGPHKYNTNKYEFQFVKEDEYKIIIK